MRDGSSRPSVRFLAGRCTVGSWVDRAREGITRAAMRAADRPPAAATRVHGPASGRGRTACAIGRATSCATPGAAGHAALARSPAPPRRYVLRRVGAPARMPRAGCTLLRVAGGRVQSACEIVANSQYHEHDRCVPLLRLILFSRFSQISRQSSMLRHRARRQSAAPRAPADSSNTITRTDCAEVNRRPPSGS